MEMFLVKKWTLEQSFAYFGAKATNPVWGWSASSGDGVTIVLTLWDDLVIDDGVTLKVDLFGRKDLLKWTDALGNRARIKHLKLARERCNGLFRVVVVTPRDKDAYPRTIASRYPHETLLMRLTDLDEQTGEFRAVSTERPLELQKGP